MLAQSAQSQRTASSNASRNQYSGNDASPQLSIRTDSPTPTRSILTDDTVLVWEQSARGAIPYEQSDTLSKSKPYRCTCDLRYAQRAGFGAHMKEWGGKPSFQCNECLKNFETAGEVHAHISHKRSMGRHQGSKGISKARPTCPEESMLTSLTPIL
jgi:hypothetical protein